MDEVTGILIFTGAMFVGLLALSWACGDFHTPQPKDSSSSTPS